MDSFMSDVAPKETPRRVPGIPDRVQEFLLCILFHFLLPLMPLLAEVMVLGYVEGRTLLIFVAIQAVAIGVSSRSRLMFGSTIVIGLVYSLFFGLLAGGSRMSALTYEIGCVCMAVVMLIHAGERYNRHVVD